MLSGPWGTMGASTQHSCTADMPLRWVGCHVFRTIVERRGLNSTIRRKNSRGDRTAIELFTAGVQGWEAGLRMNVAVVLGSYRL